jgi:hypothetical protein
MPNEPSKSNQPALLSRLAARVHGLLKRTVNKAPSLEAKEPHLTSDGAIGRFPAVIASGYSGRPAQTITSSATKTLEDQLSSVAGLFGEDAAAFKASPAAAMLRARAAHTPEAAHTPSFGTDLSA